MKILYFLMLAITVACGGKDETQVPDERLPHFDNLSFGYLSHVADVPHVSSAVLALSCEKPAVAAQEFTMTAMKQGELRLPQDGVGCFIAIKAMTIAGTRFVQDHNTTYAWDKGSVVKLVAQLNVEHTVTVQIEQQLPEVIAADRHANRFFFRVIKVYNEDSFINTSEGTPLISTVRGLVLTTWIDRQVRALPASIFRYQVVANNPYLLTKQVHFAFNCASDPGYARVLDDKLICGGNIYRDLSFVFVRGTINPSSARAADICNTRRMHALPLHNSIVSLPRTSMPPHVSSFSTIILRTKYLDTRHGVFRHSCHVYPIAPHLAPWTASYRLPYTL